MILYGLSNREGTIILKYITVLLTELIGLIRLSSVTLSPKDCFLVHLPGYELANRPRYIRRGPGGHNLLDQGGAPELGGRWVYYRAAQKARPGLLARGQAGTSTLPKKQGERNARAAINFLTVVGWLTRLHWLAAASFVSHPKLLSISTALVNKWNK